MHPEPIQKLIAHFMRLPGIGPRQASRFAYTLLDVDPATIKDFSKSLGDVATIVGRCQECFRGIEKVGKRQKCNVCSSEKIDALLVVEKDQDLESIVKSGVWQHGYHVLGGTISLMNEKTRVTDRIRALHSRLDHRTRTHAPIEVVLATSATTEGDATSLYIERVLEPFLKDKKITLTRLGRGISTGTEMEFADQQTLKNAIQNRK